MPVPAGFVDREEAFLSRWAQRHGPRFFADGAVDPEGYWGASPRVLHLLKEPNVDPSEDGWDLRGALRDAPSGRTWNMVAHWTYGLLNRLPPWTAVPRATREFRREWLRRAAVVNLNKGGGQSRSHAPTVVAAAREAAAELREQLAILDPDLIVCGGTAVLASAAVLGVPDGWARPAWGACLERPNGSRWCAVSVPHPNARMRHAVLYGYVADAARRLGLG